MRENQCQGKHRRILRPMFPKKRHLKEEEFSAIAKSYIVENSEKTPENTEISSEDLSSQMSRSLEEMKTSLNSQILHATDAVSPHSSN